MPLTFADITRFVQPAPAFHAPEDITAPARANLAERANTAYKQGLTASDQARVGLEQRNVALREKAYSDQEEQAALQAYHGALLTSDPDQIKVATDRLKAMGYSVSGDIGNERPGQQEPPPAAPAQSPENPVSAARKSSFQPIPGQDVQGKKLPSFLASFAPQAQEEPKVSAESQQTLAELGLGDKAKNEFGVEPPAEAPSEQPKAPTVAQTSLITVKRPDGTTVSELNPRAISAHQGEAIARAFAPFVANASSPAEAAAAKQAMGAALGRVGTAPLKDVIEYGWTVYKFQLDQANRGIRAETMAKVKGAGQPGKAEAAALDDESKAYEWSTKLAENSQIGKLRDGRQNAIDALQGLKGADPLAQTRAIQFLVKQMSGAAASDDEFYRVAQANGLPQRLEQVASYITGDGRYNGDPRFLQDVAQALQRTVQDANARIKEQGAAAVRAYLRHPSAAAPDYRIERAAGIWETITGEQTDPESFRKYLPKSGSVLGGPAPAKPKAGANKEAADLLSK